MGLAAPRFLVKLILRACSDGVLLLLTDLVHLPASPGSIYCHIKS